MIRKSALIGGVALLTLTACGDPSQYPGTDGNRTQEGAIAGAIAGGVLGAITGNGSRGDEIVKGAIVGGLAGGIVGNVMDKQAAELRNDFGNGQIQVINNGDELLVRMPNALLFDTDSASLKPQLRSDLLVLADSLNKYPQSLVTVTGHTDSRGDAAYNQNLSERRAGSVANALFNGGVDFSRVRALGAGENQPIATNQTAEGRAQNRRVEISIRATN
ncbi:MAG: OmpA family protein [Silicimonas sp.]|nr:OmpA family protein [Silicimonas sp.]